MKKNTRKIAVLFIMTLILVIMIPCSSEAKSKMSLSKTKLTLYIGDDARTIEVKGLNSNQTVKWKTTNKKVATVKNGKITPKKKGTTTITAIIGKKKLTCKVTVKKSTIYKFTYNDKRSPYDNKYTSKYGSPSRVFYLKVGKDIPVGVYQVSATMNGKSSDPLVYLHTKKTDKINGNNCLYMTSEGPNTNLIDAKKGQWIRILTWENNITTLTPIRSVKKFDTYNLKLMNEYDFTYALYKVGRDIPAGNYKFKVSIAGKLGNDANCNVAIADNIYYARTLCETSGKTFEKLKKESKAITILGFDPAVLDEQGCTNGYIDIKAEFTLTEGQWVCTKVPIYKVEN